MRNVYRSLTVLSLLVTFMVATPARSQAAFSATDSVWGLTASDKLVRFAAGSPGTITQTLQITGLQGGDVLVGADFRPADGKLYAVSNNSRVYRIDEASGAATLVSTITPALTGTDFGVDFNPVADRLRIVSDTEQNVRVNVDTGVASVDTAITYAGGDANAGVVAQETAVGYTNPVSGALSTTLYGIDAGTNALVIQNPPNNGTLTTVGSTGVDIGVSTGLDITPNGTLAAAITLAGGTSTGYYTINASTGAATLTGTIAAGEVVKDLMVPLPTQAPVWGLTSDNKIATLSGSGVGHVASSVAITGLQAGEDVLGIDVRPANGKLYGLGSSNRLYVIDPVTGAAHAVSTTPFTPALNGTEFGFDFNPVADRIRVTSDGDQNFRINPDTGAVIAVDTDLAYAGGDANVGANPNVVGSAYTNNVDGATTTALYNLDSGTDDLALQNPPNTGTLTTVGSTGIDVPSVTGFDIGSDSKAWAVTRVGATDTKLYQVDLSTGAATLEGQVPVALDDIAIKLTYPTGDGYVLGALDGGVFNYGSADFKGSAGSLDLNAPIISIETPAAGQGYWLTATDGGIFAYGGAKFYGSAGSIDLNQPVVGMAATPSNKGYWLVAADGGVFAYGDAQFYGSTGSIALNAPIVGMASTVTGHGYWLFAEDGGVFAYGDAAFYGSAGSIDLNQPVVGGAAAADGSGYYLVALDGGVFCYGSAEFKGSAGSITLNEPVVDLAIDRDGSGYYLVALDGGVFSYDAPFKGSAGSIDLNAPVVSIATQ